MAFWRGFDQCRRTAWKEKHFPRECITQKENALTLKETWGVGREVPTSRLDKGHRSRPFVWKHWLMWGPVTCYNHRFVQSERFPTFLICLRDSKRKNPVCLGPRVRQFHFVFSSKWWIQRMQVAAEMLTEWFPGKAAPAAHLTSLNCLSWWRGTFRLFLK